MNTPNTRHQSILRRVFRLPRILLGLATVSLPVQAATIVPETWYSSLSAGTPVGDDINFSIDASGFQHVLTYFNSTSLTNVGDSLSMSLTLSVKLGANSSGSQWPFGFGFYNSSGNQISANELGQNGGPSSPYPYTDYHGYRVRMNTAARSGNVFHLYARSSTSGSLLNAHASIAEGGANGAANTRTFQNDTPYTVTYTLTRTHADTVEISFLVTGDDLPGTYNASWSVSSTDPAFYTTFDTFAITLQSGSSTFTDITVHDATVTTPIPEPATSAALMGIGGLAFVACRRSRR